MGAAARHTRWIGVGVAAAVLAIAAVWLFGPGRGRVSEAKRELIRAVLDDAGAGLDDAARGHLARSVLAAEREFGVDALLVLAVMERESRFDPEARGRRGGLGLMQIRPPTARAMAGAVGIELSGEGDLFEPRTNVRLGTAYLARLQDEFGDWGLALSAYNMGPSRLRRLIEAGWTPPSRYARRVLRRVEELRQRLDPLAGGAAAAG